MQPNAAATAVFRRLRRIPGPRSGLAGWASPDARDAWLYRLSV